MVGYLHRPNRNGWVFPDFTPGRQTDLETLAHDAGLLCAPRSAELDHVLAEGALATVTLLTRLTLLAACTPASRPRGDLARAHAATLTHQHARLVRAHLAQRTLTTVQLTHVHLPLVVLKQDVDEKCLILYNYLLVLYLQ